MSAHDQQCRVQQEAVHRRVTVVAAALRALQRSTHGLNANTRWEPSPALTRPHQRS